jgi:outer membrane lipoprotein-sorting protein
MSDVDAMDNTVRKGEAPMRSHRALLFCPCTILAIWLGTGTACGQTRDELFQLVQDYRAKISDMDVSFTYVSQTLAEDPVRPNRRPIPKSMTHIKQRGAWYFKDQVSWKTGREEPVHMITACDGEREAVYDVDHNSVSISEARPRIESGNWIYTALKWPQQPTPAAYSDLLILIAARHTTILPEREIVYGTETVVLEYAGLEKVWLDVQHGGIVRKSETWQLVGGPKLWRTEIPELHEVNGVYLPARLVRTRFARKEAPEALWNTPVSRFTVTIPKETLKINSGFTKEDFQLDLPPDTHVYDGIAGTEYTVGATAGQEGPSD